MKQVFDFSVGEAQANSRLDELLAVRLEWLSRMHIRTLIATGACKIGGENARAGQKVRLGDTVEVTCDIETATAMTPEALPLDVVYEDDHLLVIIKAAEMLMHPTRGISSGTLANALAYHLNRKRIENDPMFSIPQGTPCLECPPSITNRATRPGLVHRLDRATSGLVVVAKTMRSLSVLSRHFHERRVAKGYAAVLTGCVREDELTITAPIGRDAAADMPKWRVMSEGKHSESRLRVIARASDRTLVEMIPITGRTNQLRIHAAHIGRPIFGDGWYGGAHADRLCLHASRLAFHHPANGEWMEFTSVPPTEMMLVWDESLRADESDSY